jgi:hypothetical protein
MTAHLHHFTTLAGRLKCAAAFAALAASAALLCPALVAQAQPPTPSTQPPPATQPPARQQPDESSATAPDSAAPQPARWQWTFTFRNRTGLRLDEPRVLQMSRTTFEAKGVYKIGDEWRLTMEGRAHVDPVRRLGYPKNVWLDPRQFLIDGKIKKVGVSLGLQQVVWGQADGLRVLDVINPLDYREFILEDFLDSRRPLWMARADVPVGKGSVQFVFVPYFAPGRLPVGNDEFALGPAFGLGLISAATTATPNSTPLPFSVAPTARPAYRLSYSQAGVRYSRSFDKWGAWDVTANYFYGWEDVPTPYLATPQLSLPSSPPTPRLDFAPRYDRKEIFGGTAATNFGPVVFRMEAGWSTRKSVAVNHTPPGSGFEQFGQFSGVVGADYSPREWLWLSGQYFLQFTSAPARALLFPRYNHLASFYARTNFLREKLRPELFVLTGLNEKQYLVRPRLTRSLGDEWSVGVGADFLGGRAIYPFGYFASRDRVVMELKWTK